MIIERGLRGWWEWYKGIPTTVLCNLTPSSAQHSTRCSHPIKETEITYRDTAPSLVSKDSIYATKYLARSEERSQLHTLRRRVLLV